MKNTLEILLVHKCKEIHPIPSLRSLATHDDSNN